MLRSEKEVSVKELEELYKSSGSLVFTHYHGLTVSQITKLRNILRSKGAGLKIVKNTLSKIACQNVKLSGDEKMFTGPVAVAYSEDQVSAAKAVVEFAKANTDLKVVCGIFNNDVISESEVRAIAELPSLEELRGKIVGLLQAPAAKVVGIVQAPAGKVARVIGAYAAK